MPSINDRTFSGRTDSALVARAQAGDTAAFGELARRHGSALRAFLRRMGAQSALADDLAQDALMAGFRNLTALDDRAAFAAWVRTIAARLYIRRWRSDARTELVAEPPEADDGPIPDVQMHSADRLDLDQAMQSLLAVQRLCIALCYGAGLSHAEAAEALNLPLGTVKSHVKRGLQRLRGHLTQDETDRSSAHG